MVTGRIELNDVNEMKNIILLPDPNEMVNIWTMINEHGFIFDKFVLIVKPLDTIFKVHIEGLKENQIIHVKRIWKDLKGISHNDIQDVSIDMFFSKYAALMEKFFREGYNAARGNDTVDLILPFNFMQYVVYTGIHREVEYIDPAIRSTSIPRKKYNKNTNKIYSLSDCIKIYQHKNKNRKYEYTKESWPRRGGVRHLKSGKVITYRSTTCSPKNKPPKKDQGGNYKL